MPRRTLGHYEILAPLGRGGMGEVFRARDTNLDREVALKLLTGELARDDALLARFDREAKLLAALNHPNIAAIHSLEHAEGKPFLVLELIDGQTLQEIMRRGITLPQAIDIARQIAAALAMAHARQVIHRDLKPANVMVTPEGIVKLLDFGIAKTVHADGPLTAMDETTASGLVVGTVPYMSPEQIRGRPLDARSDVWSFGCVLFELLAGRPPCRRETTGDTLAAIVAGEVDWKALPAATPQGIGNLLHRCLQVDPERRLRDVNAARLILEAAARSEPGEEIHAPPQAVSSGSQVGVAAVGLLALVGALLLAYTAGWLERTSTHEAADLTVAPIERPTPLTSLVGSEVDPALSSDGRYVAFAWDGGNNGNLDLYVQLIGSGDPLRLTTGGTDVREPAWSPDASEIVYLRRGESTWAIESVPPLGGAVTRLATASAVAFPGLDYSPSGDLLAVVDRPEGVASESIYLIDRRSGERHRLSYPPLAGLGDRDPAFSPDGARVAFVRWYEIPHAEIHIADRDGNVVLLAEHDAHIVGLDWTADGSGLVFTSDRGGGATLWHLSLEGDARRLPLGDNARELDIAPGLLVYSLRTPDSNLWLIGGPTASEGFRQQPLAASTRDDWAPDVSPDGRRVAFMSDRSGASRLWICDIEGTSATGSDRDPKQFNVPAPTASASWSRHAKSGARRTAPPR